MEIALPAGITQASSHGLSTHFSSTVSLPIAYYQFPLVHVSSCDPTPKYHFSIPLFLSRCIRRWPSSGRSQGMIQVSNPVATQVCAHKFQHHDAVKPKVKIFGNNSWVFSTQKKHILVSQVRQLN